MPIEQLLAKKSLEQLAAEAKGENRLRRILWPIGLTSLGIGAIIGAGIFVMTGRAAAQDAGPAIMLSFVVAGLGCLFAALCYAEFASLAPVAGSAYTYAYATLGELLAWIKPMVPTLRRVFLVHGEPQQSEALAKLLFSHFGLDVVRPNPGDSFELG